MTSAVGARARDKFMTAVRVVAPLIIEIPLCSNRGPALDPMVLAVGGQLGDYWCVHAMQYCGRAVGNLWPFPVTGYCPTIFGVAKARGMVRESWAHGEPGDLVLYWDETLGRFAHIGALWSLDVHNFQIETYEGNTSNPAHAGDPNDPTGRNGVGFYRKHRTLEKGDVLIDWTKGL